MNNQDFPGTSDLLKQLSAASEGLMFMSETDYPFEVVHLPDVKDSGSLPAALTKKAALPEDEKIEVVDLPNFFRNMTRDEPEEENNRAHRFRALQAVLEQNLQEVKVYRVGKRRIKAYIMGRTSAGDYAGLQTMLVET